MSEINKLTSVDTVSAGDSVPVYSNANGDARRITFLTCYGIFRKPERRSAGDAVRCTDSDRV
jgi:hypothetical protein